MPEMREMLLPGLYTRFLLSSGLIVFPFFPFTCTHLGVRNCKKSLLLGCELGKPRAFYKDGYIIREHEC